jgi:accessory gene regulator B
VTTIAAGIIIIVLAPVEDSNKPLDEIEANVYKKRTSTVLIVEICVFLIATVLGLDQIVYCITVSLLVLSVMLILGKIKNSANQNNYS